ncbi:Transposon Ty3-G Gag-Pol polyprotein [Vitis vinifera]|uniref:Transposon Ty3-G Gag-Pol polyprotein n=1 Tax=Vitis vinifera TaxID=29760 RepID=A0A438GYI3_VITVI|nr:Transposon Ty3-G Gag-Pol polyprotein [Vitis vinifera]
MDLSIFEYLPVSCDIDLSAPSSPTSQIFDIDDEIAQHDSDDDSSSVSDSDPVDQRVSPAVGDTEIVDFGTTDQPRELRIGSDLSTDERDSLIQLLRAYLDVFAWSYEDMPGLDPSIVQHRLPLLPHARPVKQKLRRLHPRWSLQVKEEIQKQLSVGFLSVVEYPEWLANVVPVPKKDGKVRVCVDFRDLNKASPKDDFPLPHIDMLVDSTAGHSMLSFMDGFSGYSQILMAPEDMEKTSFITEWGTYCYRVMPFGLKNAGATYQRAATTLFHDMMHRDVEVYVDDMIVKSRGRSDHLAALERFFERIRQFRLRLNPKKCTFGVTSGKLLGYMVSERGIEVDPDKIRAILDMPAPRTERRSEASWADFSTSADSLPD